MEPPQSVGTQWRISGSLARVGSWACESTTPGRREPREHDWPTAAFSTAGVYSVYCARGRAVVDPLQVLFLNLGEPYQTGSVEAEPCSGVSLALSPGIVHEVFGKDSCPRLATASPPALVARVAELVRGSTEPEAFDEAALSVAAALSSARRGDPYRSPGITPRSARLVDGARSMLASRLRERLPLPLIAGSLGVSPFHLCRVFRAAMGETIHQSLTRLRIIAAIEPVLDGVNLTALSFELGFASQSHFGAAFKREIGTSPSRFRRESRLRRSSAHRALHLLATERSGTGKLGRETES